jgi:hypothetical protein
MVGAGLSYFFTSMAERRRQRWTLQREWRGLKLQVYGAYVADVKRMRDLAQRIAAGVQLDDQAPPLSRDAGSEPLAEANMARSSSFETVTLIGGKAVVEAGRGLNRAVWRLEWFARGFFDDTDRAGWAEAFHSYHAAIDRFHESARLDIGVTAEFSPRPTEPSPRDQYDRDRIERIQPPAVGRFPYRPGRSGVVAVDFDSPER